MQIWWPPGDLENGWSNGHGKPPHAALRYCLTRGAETQNDVFLEFKTMFFDVYFAQILSLGPPSQNDQAPVPRRTAVARVGAQARVHEADPGAGGCDAAA